jgi:hypothetical protein
MKYIYKFLIIAIAVGFSTSCNESVNPWTGDSLSGGLINPVSSSLNYVVGSGATYSVPFEVEQGPNTTSQVEVYKSFYSVTDGVWSNEVLESTITISDNVTHVNADFSIDYAQLISGLKVAGIDLPTSDTQLTIGDYWNFRLVSTVSNGSTVESRNKVKLAVSTRFAGTYKVLASSYYRIGVDGGDWNGDMVSVESIDAQTYRQLGWAHWLDGNELFFQVDGNNDITIPAEWNGTAQTGNGNPLMTCASDPGDMTNARCGDADNYTVLLDNVNGKDIITMSFGYYTAGSGPREFYQQMEKVVN